MSQESNEDTFSIEEEWNGIQERLKKIPYQMKLEMKKVLRQLTFLDTTMLSPSPRKVPTKGANKKVDIARSRAKVASTSRIPSSREVVDSQNLDIQPSPPSTTSSFSKRKGARFGKTSRSPLPPPTRFPKPIPIPKPILVPTSISILSPIDYIPKFMVPFIEKVVDVIGDEHYGFWAITEFMGLTEESHIMIRRHLIQELKDHKDDYVGVYAGEDRYNCNALFLLKR